MELSKSIIEDLSVAGNSTELSDPLFNHLLTDVFEVANGNSDLKNKDDKSNVNSEKNIYNSLLSFSLEAAKCDVDASFLSSLLEECKMESSRIALYLKKFQDEKEKIQTRLALIGKSFDQIIDVKWRQDFVVKSNNCEKISEPSYIILLKTWNPMLNAEKDVTFSCTLEQLQDLVLKLKDATKCIERNAV